MAEELLKLCREEEPPREVIEAAVMVGHWFAERNIDDWMIGPCASRTALVNKADMVKKAMRIAWQLGQIYWQQADSQYTRQHRKADETETKFRILVHATLAAITPDVTPNKF